MKKTWIPAVLLAGLLAGGCGAASSASSTTSTQVATGTKTTPRAWLTTTAVHWNKQLNQDQNTVDTAAAATIGVSSSTFYSRLTSACTKLRDDARQAMSAPKAPTASLQEAWAAMLSATVSYASKCLTLPHSNSSADINAWQTSLTSMNNANDHFNTVADAAARTSSSTSTTSGSSH